MEKKAQLGLGIVKSVMIMFLILSIIAISILIVLPLMRDVSPLVIITANDSSEYILADNNSAQTLSQSVVVGSSVVTNKNRTFLKFDGTNDYLDVDIAVGAGDLIRSDESHSFSVWFNSSQDDGGKLFNISVNWSLGIGIDGNISGGLLTYTLANASLRGHLNSTVNMSTGSWNHVVVTFDDVTDNISMYLNGEVNSSIIVLNPTNLGTILSFSSSNSTNSLNGDMDEIRIYNRTLNGTQVKLIYNSGREANSSINSTDLMWWFPINEGTGTDLHSINLSGSTTFATAISGATWTDDNVNVTLTENTDYTTLTTTFTIINQDFAWNRLYVNYSYDITTKEAGELVGNVTKGIKDFFTSTGTIFAILIVVVIILAIAIIIAVVSRFGGGEVGAGRRGGYGSETVMGV